MRFIDKVANEALRQKVIDYYEENDELIRMVPTSTSGKYHPPDENKPGAMILHGDKVAWFCLVTAREFRLSQREIDILIVAAYMHDIANATVAMGFKPVLFSFEDSFQRGHQLSPSRELRAHHAHHSARVAGNLVKGTLPHEDLVKLYRIIERHMAHWYDEDDERAPELPETDLEKWFALADMVMSRKEMRIEFED